jgi:hypothetical protein
MIPMREVVSDAREPVPRSMDVRANAAVRNMQRLSKQGAED